LTLTSISSGNCWSKLVWSTSTISATLC
jgi:hypothetical protein